jgi:hypothetical protein
MPIARPLSDLPRFLGAVAVASHGAAAEASNAAALIVVRAIRSQLPTRRLHARTTSRSGKRSGTGVNYAYLEASAEVAKFRPTALIVGRGPVHILENPIGPHRITLGVRRGPDGRIRDIVSPRGNTVSRRRGGLGPSLGDAGFTAGNIVVPHPGVKRTTGPLRRGITLSSGTAMRKWQTTFTTESLKVKGF